MRPEQHTVASHVQRDEHERGGLALRRGQVTLRAATVCNGTSHPAAAKQQSHCDHKSPLHAPFICDLHQQLMQRSGARLGSAGERVSAMQNRTVRRRRTESGKPHPHPLCGLAAATFFQCPPPPPPLRESASLHGMFPDPATPSYPIIVTPPSRAGTQHHIGPSSAVCAAQRSTPVSEGHRCL